MICTNTMHKVADQVVAAVALPLLHIAEATGVKIVQDGIEAVGLLGTRFTMEEKFYRSVLEDRFGLQVVVPAAEDRRLVDRVIFDELCRGVISEESKKEYLRIVDTLADQGCGAIVLGCTEIALLIGSEDTDLTLYDTTEIHAQQAVAMMLDQ